MLLLIICIGIPVILMFFHGARLADHEPDMTRFYESVYRAEAKRLKMREARRRPVHIITTPSNMWN